MPGSIGLDARLDRARRWLDARLDVKARSSTQQIMVPGSMGLDVPRRQSSIQPRRRLDEARFLDARAQGAPRHGLWRPFRGTVGVQYTKLRRPTRDGAPGRAAAPMLDPVTVQIPMPVIKAGSTPADALQAESGVSISALSRLEEAMAIPVLAAYTRNTQRSERGRALLVATPTRLQ